MPHLIFKPPNLDLSKFHVLVVISNPFRYESRYKLYDIFSEDVQRKGANLWTVEMQTGARIHRVTDMNDEKHHQVWSSALSGSVWHKENLINIGIANIIKFCPDARYIMWIDGDVKSEPGLIEETAHALQHWDFVQPWSHAIHLGPDQEALGVIQKSFMYCHWHGIDVKSLSGYAQGGHPGFVWAARRDALNKVGVPLASGPLIDWGCLGSADRHMACALVGKVEWSYHAKVHGNYKKWLHMWQETAEKNIKRNVGYIAHTLRHLYHGTTKNRGYSSRWSLLVKHQFNPETDIKRDVSGVWNMVSDTPRQIEQRDDFRRYFFSRKEDQTTE